jgi:hypothetical protein
LGLLSQGRNNNQQKNTLLATGNQGKNSRQFDDPKMIESVPLSAPGQNSRNEGNI